MSTVQSPPGKIKRFRKYLRAFGRAHGKARRELESSRPLLDHLEELRKRLFRAFAAVVITTLLSFSIAAQLIDYLAKPLGGRQGLVSIEVTENIAIFMRVSLLSGLVLGSPFVFYQIMRFILPGLKGRERLWLLIGVAFSTFLFLGGVTFTWFIMIPTALPFLVNFMGITTEVRPQNYFEFVTRLLFWIGVCFEMPLFITILAKFKFVTVRQLLSGWRYAFVGIAIVAAAVTPTPDPVNMGLVMLPLGALYVISLLSAAIVGMA